MRRSLRSRRSLREAAAIRSPKLASFRKKLCGSEISPSRGERLPEWRSGCCHRQLQAAAAETAAFAGRSAVDDCRRRLRTAIDNLIAAIEDGVKLHADELDGLRMNEILDAMERSRASGATEAVVLYG